MSFVPADMLLKRTIAADEPPVSVAEVKSDLRIEHSEDDATIAALIAAATAMTGAPDGITGKALTTETWTLSVPRADSCGRIFLPITPVQSITSIAYYDADNAVQTLSVSDFYLFANEDTALIEKKDGSWPAVYDRRDAVTVTFVAGFGDAESVPANIRHAIRLMAAHWYEHRLAVSDRPMTEVPMGAAMLLGASRKGWVV
jgi:uncharacterized phiE125 gp8 family phage protein